eukprot:g63447.t1
MDGTQPARALAEPVDPAWFDWTGQSEHEFCCCICSGLLQEAVQTKGCGHLFCGPCLRQWRKNRCLLARNGSFLAVCAAGRSGLQVFLDLVAREDDWTCSVTKFARAELARLVETCQNTAISVSNARCFQLSGAHGIFLQPESKKTGGLKLKYIDSHSD